ncbi:beta-ketoacyl synthase N-terminal-like domain-containing protein, partial [Paenibacillus maysiensis]|uniref:beta-ketoacyl synthase N-terminal-like domain-containing protein n=1 Tax=Paenibacillus maysiensis TaxID=1155954 RepID=UPI001FD77BC0
MDPQQRLFLEQAWHCIEDAGLRPSSLSGTRCGVFAGCAASDYAELVGSGGWNAQGLMGRALSILSARISYHLNLKGPCLAIETACSSSLVAIAEACESLSLGTSDLALAGGVYVAATPAMQHMTGNAGMLSPSGRCYTFDNRADGFVPGEGVGVILLKRLQDAERDGDHIYGVIRGWGVNQDGKTNGITAPSVNSQTVLEQEVYRRFQIDPATISLVEAHGTGTRLGDPIEVEALTAAFHSFTTGKNYCALGSVKSNIGHLLAASGMAGVIKTLLALKHQMLPPTLHFESLNEHIDLQDSPFYINTQLQPWRSEVGRSRRAAVSAFGFSGTNAHIVLEEYAEMRESSQLKAAPEDHRALHFVLSAQSPERLGEYAAALKYWLEC